MKVFALIPIILYGIVGVISLIMAFKNLSSKSLIAFHVKASVNSVTPWRGSLIAVIGIFLGIVVSFFI